MPRRPRQSAARYRQIWSIDGSPLLVISRLQARAFEAELNRHRRAEDEPGDDARAERVAAAFRAGIVWVNCSQPTFTEAPWGGMKQSGIGRELGHWGLENYLETKQITRLISDEPWGWYIK